MMDRIGNATAIIARETPDGLQILDGHLRRDIADDADVSVLVVDLDDDESDPFLATVDPIAAMAEADRERLEALLAPLEDMPEIDWSDLYGVDTTPEQPPTPDDIVEPVAEPVTQRGDVWALGRHRLMCGDSKEKADVDRLLCGAKPSLMVTDPPYGVNYDAGWRQESLPRGASRVGVIANDDTTDWSGILEVYDGADITYVWSPPGDNQLVFATILQLGGFEIRAQLIWRKQTHVLSRGHYHWQHEPCWYAVRKDATARWIGDRSGAARVFR